MKWVTKRLILSPIALDDKNEIFEYRYDKKTNKDQGWIPETADDAVTFIGKTKSEMKNIKIHEKHENALHLLMDLVV